MGNQGCRRTRKLCKAQQSSITRSRMPSFHRRIRSFTINWLRVLDTAKRSQVDQRIRQQFHAIVPLLDAFKTEQEPLELVLPRKGAFDPHPSRMDGGVEEAFASTLGRLAVARILCDVGNQASIEHTLAIVGGIKAPIEV